MSRRLSPLVLIACGALLAPGTAAAATTYVDEDRPDNSGDCLTPASACRTLTGAGNAIGKAGAGGTVLIDGGTYAEGTTVVPMTGQSLIYQEINAADPPAIVDGGTTTGIGIGNYDVGTIQGLTIRGNISALQAFGDVSLIGNTFDEGTPPTVFTTGIVHLQGEGAGAEDFELIGNTFSDPTPADLQVAIRAPLGGTSNLTARDNSFNGFFRSIDMDGFPAQSYSSSTHVIDDNTFTGMHQIPDPMDPMNFIPGIALFVEGGSLNLTDNLAGSPGVGFIFGYSAFAGASVTSARNEAYNLEYGFDFNDVVNLSMDGDIAAHNSAFGIYSVDNDASATGGNLDARNVTSWANDTDISVFDADLDLTSSIVQDPISGAPTNCTIAFSRGPTTTGGVCETFQTTADPAFVDPATGINNFHLTAGSPMIDMGSTIAPLPGTLDVDGDPRVVAGVCGGTARTDIGADEFVPNCAPPPPPPGDKDPPETTIIKKPGKKIQSGKTTIKFTSDEPGSTFECQLDKKPFATCRSPQRLRKLRPGKHKFQVRAVDPAGNADPTPVGVKFRVARS